MQAVTGLIAEGGGMRGAYTAGVLEAFLDHNITFPYAIGVSAGANTLCSYLSGQKGRNKRIYTHWITDKRFIGIKNLFSEGSYFGMHFLFDELPQTLDPFDFEAIKRSKTCFRIGVTNCETGKCEYLDPLTASSIDAFDQMFKASSSLPLISKIVTLNGKPYLDGGIADSIPIEKAVADGYERNVIILTRNLGYRKSYSKHLHFLARKKLKRYPKLVDAIGNRYKMYNDTLEKIAALEKEGKVFVLRPQKPLDVDRFEKDQRKLEALYEQGYEDAICALPALKAFISQ